MKHCIFSILLSMTLTSIKGQIYDNIFYSGLPGDVQTHSYNVNSNSELRIEFITFSVSDSIRISIGPYTYRQTIGKGETEAYNEILIESDWSIDTVHWQVVGLQPIPYPSWTCMLVAYLTVPTVDCVMSIEIIGNKELMTDYSLLIQTVHDAPFLPDTIFVKDCDNVDNSGVYYIGCQKIVKVDKKYNNFSNFTIFGPTCDDSDDGYIEFKDSTFTLSGFSAGYYELIVGSGECVDTLKINITPQHICTYFVPNVFNPTSHYNNEFKLFTQIDLPYNLKVFDRWGDLVFNQDCVSNVNGWNGTGYKPSVYTYLITYQGQQIAGDVTLLR